MSARYRSSLTTWLFCTLCEAPLALKSHGIFSGKKITSHPSVDKQLKEAGKLVFSSKSSSYFLFMILTSCCSLLTVFLTSSIVTWKSPLLALNGFPFHCVHVSSCTNQLTIYLDLTCGFAVTGTYAWNSASLFYFYLSSWLFQSYCRFSPLCQYPEVNVRELMEYDMFMLDALPLTYLTTSKHWKVTES